MNEETRMFYPVCYKLGNNLMLRIPTKISKSLSLNDRDELEVAIKKTGRVIEKFRERPNSKGFGNESKIREQP